MNTTTNNNSNILKRKDYDHQMYLDSDPKCRKVLIDYFGKRGIILKEGGQYDVDLISEDKTKAFEIEHRTSGWITPNKYPYEQITIVGRKFHWFLDELPYKKVYLVYMSTDFKSFIVTERSIIKPRLINKEYRRAYSGIKGVFTEEDKLFTPHTDWTHFII